MDLITKIQSRQAVIAVIGLGYVGLPVSVVFAEAGFSVIGIDVDKTRVAAVNSGQSYIPDVPSETIGTLTTKSGQLHPGKLHAVDDYGVLEQSDIAIVCVPTPLRKTKDPDLSYIMSAADEISRKLHPGMLVVLESTTYPGTTEEIILPRLENAQCRNLRAGLDFFLAFSPERIDPGRTDWTARNTPKVIGGITGQCLEMAKNLYETAFEEIVPVSSTRAAEMVKMLENTFRATNIALVNEIAIMCRRLDVDVWEVINAARTKPFGFMPFYPGPGLGGHCIPVDPHYLAWKLKRLNYNARFIQLAEEINLAMPAFVVGAIADALNNVGKSLKGSLISVLGVSYKANVGDIRESPALDVIDILIDKEAVVRYHDPYVPHIRWDGKSMDSIELDEAALRESDCVVIATDHRSYDWQWVVNNSRLVFDTRNATAGVTAKKGRVVKL